MVADPDLQIVFKHLASGDHEKAAHHVKKRAFDMAKAASADALHQAAAGITRGFTKGFENSTKVGAHNVETIPGPTNLSGTTVSETLVSGAATMRMRSHDNSPAVVHKVKCVTGRPTSKALKILAKTQPVVRTTLFDTKVQDFAAPSVPRGVLTNSSGFNTRQFHIPSRLATVHYSDILNITQASGSDQRPDGLTQAVYASVLDTTTRFSIHNQSAYFPMKMKIHMVKPLDVNPALYYAVDIQTNCLHANLTSPPPSAAASKKVPIYYQASTVSATGAGAAAQIHWEHSLKGNGLLDSPYFKNNYKIVKTFTQVIKPTDTMQFSHTHKYGGGVDIYSLLAQNVQGLEAGFLPTSYFYILETCGAQTGECTFLRSAGVLEPYYGVVPSFYLLEYQKVIRYITTSQSSLDLTDTGVPIAPIHLRYYSNDPSFLTPDNNQVEFRLLSENIRPSGGVAVGQGYINTTTDTAVVTSTVTSGVQDTGG